MTADLNTCYDRRCGPAGDLDNYCHATEADMGTMNISLSDSLKSFVRPLCRG